MADIHGFELVRERDVPELNSVAKFFKHKKTGAELLSVENDDENKVFGITFKTPSANSTGVAHIMEHSVLCGSRKFPVKEPFVELIKGSLHTFLNAFTYPDKTCYPVASTNERDFYNLVDVYLDAVFHPNLHPYTLQQEGWHYELEDPEKPMIFKGVVFNEMKGSYSSPDRVLMEYSQQCIFPDNIYAYSSGGDPKAIPDLSWEQFKSFHDEFYHPSNSRIYFYGNDPIEKRFEILDEYLRDFDRRKPQNGIVLQPNFSEPKSERKFYSVGDAAQENKAMMTVNWLLPANLDTELALSLAVLDHIIAGTAASPLHKALIDSGLGEEVTGVGLENEMRQMSYSIGLKGIAEDSVGAVENVILDTLKKLVTEGIDPERIEASLNTTEFRMRENNTGSYPRGLILMLRALTPWLYDGDPLAAISFEQPLQNLKNAFAENAQFFEGLIQKYFLDNSHRVTLSLLPDPELQQREDAQEQERLVSAKAAMSDEELAQVVENTRVLKERQAKPDAPEDLAKIPSLSLDDLDKAHSKIPIEIIEENRPKILYHDLFTNGIAYLSLGFDLKTLPESHLPLLSLFSRSLLQIGTDKEDFVQLSQRIGRKTGGVRPSVYTTTANDRYSTIPYLLLSGKVMMHQVDDLFEILTDLTTIVNFDNQERFVQMLLEEKAGMESALVSAGHTISSSRLKALFSETGWLGDQTGGVSYYFSLLKLIEKAQSDWASVLAALQDMYARVFSRKGFFCNVTLDGENWKNFKPRLDKFIDALPETNFSQEKWQAEKGAAFQGLTVPTQVNYVGKAMNIYDLGYEFHGSAYVAQKFLRTSWLWEKVRVQGGAYGAFCSFERKTGFFGFTSYRDPNTLETIDNFDNAGKFLRQVSLSADEIRKSIIGTISDIDGYQLPDAKGYSSMSRHLSGVTDDELQKIRDEVLGTTEKDVRAFGEVVQQLGVNGKVAIVGSNEQIAEINREKNDWLEVIKVL